MAAPQPKPAFGTAILVAVALSLSIYFTFAAVQGNYGLFRRIEIEAEIRDLRIQQAALAAEVSRLENKTRRMSDAYLDLDLLDEQARSLLGLVRSDEIVVR